MLEINVDTEEEPKYQKVLLSDKIGKNKSSGITNSLFCYLHLLLIIGIYLLFYWNYSLTHNAIAENKYLPLNPETIFSNEIESFNICLQTVKAELNQQDNNKENNLIDKCAKNSEKLEICYDNVFYFNKYCSIFSTEYAICLSKNMSCNGIISDIKECAMQHGYAKFKELVAASLHINNT